MRIICKLMCFSCHFLIFNMPKLCQDLLFYLFNAKYVISKCFILHPVLVVSSAPAAHSIRATAGHISCPIKEKEAT